MRYAYVIVAAALAAAGCSGGGEGAAAGEKGAAGAGKPVVSMPGAAGLRVLSGEGDKNALPDGAWFVWKFDKKPQLGTVVAVVRIFDKDGGRVTSCEVTGESGMPSMRYHDTGKVKFRLNKKGDYLLPVDVVMAGEWELVIRVMKDGKEIFAGRTDYSV